MRLFRIDFKIKKVMIDEKCCKLQIWDTAGQERFRTITKAYYRGAMGIMLVYDTTDDKSFENVRNWMKNIEQNAAPSVNKILIGNKSDSAKRAVSTEMGQALAQEFGIEYFETSAKTGSYVEDAFISISRNVKNRLEKEKPAQAGGAEAPVGVIKATKEKKQKKKCC